MRKTILLLLLSSLTYGQSAKEMLAEIDGKWQLDDNQNVTIVKVIEAPNLKKEEIFNRALNYFAYNYVSGKSQILTQDIENGLIIAQGIYDDVHIGISFESIYIDAWHVLRVDAKDGRARIIITLTDYEEEIVDEKQHLSTYSIVKINQQYPINPEGRQKTMMAKAFYKAFKKINNTVNALDKAIIVGNTSKAIEDMEW
jgi:hypothetical protein